MQKLTPGSHHIFLARVEAVDIDEDRLDENGKFELNRADRPCVCFQIRISEDVVKSEDLRLIFYGRLLKIPPYIPVRH